MPVKFNDYSMKVNAALNDITINWLYDASGEVEAHVKRNCKMAREGEAEGRNLRESYKSVVDESKGEALVGSSRESVYWEEFGTGSQAAHGDGRKGWWVYVKNGETRKKRGQTYATQAEAQEVADFLREVKKLDAYATNGRDPNYTLENAFKKNSAKLKRRLEEQLGEGLGK